MERGNIVTFAPVTAFAVFAAMLGLGLSEPKQTLGDGYLDRPLPPFDQPPLAGTNRGLSSEDFSDEIVLINVFSSWCAACKAEHPYLMQFADETDIALYGVNWKDRPGAGKAFLDQFGNPYKDTGADLRGNLGVKLGVTGVPETYLIDGQGRIRYRHLGPMTKEVWIDIIKPLITRIEARS